MYIKRYALILCLGMLAAFAGCGGEADPAAEVAGQHEGIANALRQEGQAGSARVGVTVTPYAPSERALPGDVGSVETKTPDSKGGSADLSGFIRRYFNPPAYDFLIEFAVSYGNWSHSVAQTNGVITNFGGGFCSSTSGCRFSYRITAYDYPVQYHQLNGNSPLTYTRVVVYR